MKYPLDKIPVEMFRTVHTKDASGKRVASREKYRAYKKIKCVETGPRIGHYLLDALVLIGVLLLLQAGFAAIGIDLTAIEERSAGFSIPLFDLRFISFTFIFYFLFEWKFQRSPGKWITRTIVVDQYGEKPDAGTVALRSICRLIPFDSLSCLSDTGRGWHDKLSKTYVLPMSEYEEIKDILANLNAENVM